MADLVELILEFICWVAKSCWKSATVLLVLLIACVCMYFVVVR